MRELPIAPIGRDMRPASIQQLSMTERGNPSVQAERAELADEAVVDHRPRWTSSRKSANNPRSGPICHNG